jgi:HPt (histidine-containing phosphotransfer) domain-containing protein
MAQPAIKLLEEMEPEVDAALAIDRNHLARMTYGDRSLERELLELFDRQAAILLARMRTADAASVAALAHTLRGSALGVGASRVAQAAAAVEAAGDAAEREPAVDHLAVSVAGARTCIATLLRAV